MGKVYLIGAGPGDVGLITVKGLNCIKTADVVVYDYLASPRLLAYAREDAEIIYVGKKGGDHTLSQDGINALLVEKARAGNTVARLKGGDPFIFGRGGEEAEVLVEKGVPFEIVPGVTSAIAAPAYAGIPLTHRKHTATVAFVTGHEDPTKDGSNIDWSKISTGIGTIVFLMGIKNLPMITQKLKENGRAPNTPVALVRWGTTPGQETVTGTLDTISDVAEKAGIKPPAVIVVGEVVDLRPMLSWFETKPLFGRKILVTRSRKQASTLVDKLLDLGADCIETPTIELVPPQDKKPLEDAVDAISSYDWVVLTSVNGVDYFFDCLFAQGKDARALGNAKVAAIGPATSARLKEYGLVSDIVPKTYRAESVVEAFMQEDMQGKKVLLPRAKQARPILPVELTKMGALVDEVPAYETVQASQDQARALWEKLETGQIDMVTFTSSSTVSNFVALFDKEKLLIVMEGVKTASIGPITSDTARDLSIQVDMEAEEYTIDGLVQAIVDSVGKK
ncbi:MAG: uroporphyrinogen-III C-methyltransferase [Desulfatibacillum sp.]|nr:uroporphyrinogen-III C-methyltransferase [Desulfatibacillum sp.]